MYPESGNHVARFIPGPIFTLGSNIGGMEWGFRFLKLPTAPSHREGEGERKKKRRRKKHHSQGQFASQQDNLSWVYQMGSATISENRSFPAEREHPYMYKRHIPRILGILLCLAFFVFFYLKLVSIRSSDYERDSHA